MVSNAYRLPLIVFTALLSLNCNLEVGNPENEFSDAGKVPGFNRLSLAATNYSSCTTTDANCVSVPVVLTEGEQPKYRFEMTEVKLQLNEVTVKPYATEAIWTLVDLIRGSEVVFSEYKDSALVSEVDLGFSGGAKTRTNTYSISGNLVTDGATGKVVIPVNLAFAGDIMAVASATGSGTVTGVDFDAALWFNFTANGNEMSRVLANLSVNVCNNTAARSCTQYGEALARRVAEQIGKSAKMKRTGMNQKLNVKTNLGGSK
ncbi:hypothetical protein [Turneriella parva]|uniref:Uncharacterized protein n=1 Tax=Turneriella parva (strain ATCC BAA-1111 / DSM 21527 / NCTC 11395 / H) TaxID=869212 RepID=I4BBR9_TURPD|nr:hypothetical protein [Turneriella parva]AFM14726.1 hypothetical protein Turpa_4093 [Turneriella parva DSM 21527]